MTTQSRSLRLANQLHKQGFAWPGGYPLFALLDDGGILCRHCAGTERRWIATTTGSDGWCVQALAINYEDPELRCSHCNAAIEAAYA